jgi:hypothetical protein
VDVTNYENGGITNDTMITNPDDYFVGRQQIPRKEYPVRYYDTWNTVKQSQFFLTHRYNLGFKRMERFAEGDTIAEREVFIPVSSIVHTFSYEDYFRRFISNMNGIDDAYLIPSTPGIAYNPDRQRLNYVYGIDEKLNEVNSGWTIKNTVALSLREGFQDWAKFGLTAFARIENRRFRLPATIPGLTYDPVNGSGPNPQPTSLFYSPSDTYNEFSTYLGAELSKRQGSILTYNARGELSLVGDDLGEFRIDGNLQTTFPLFGKEASISARGYLRNVTPAFFQRHQHSRYFWWDADLSNTQQFRAEGIVNLESTNTTVSAGVESIQNYIYFDRQGMPQQYGSNLQVVSARLQQNFYYRGFGWENTAEWQLSSNEDVLPLPQISAYTNLYVYFKLAKVLTVQLGADAHYHTKYYAPYYEPATQQFILQNEKKIGNYPLINGYANFHLKQARFFVMFYNLGASIFNEPEYFSLLHYPLNPMVVKLGVSVMFNN